METLKKESTSMNVVEASNRDYSQNEKLVERYPIKNSPFTVITVENEHFGVMGEYRMTEGYKTRGECEDELKKMTWNRIIQVMFVLSEIREKDKEFNKNVKKSLKTKNNKKK